MQSLNLPYPMAWADKHLVKKLHSYIENFSETDKVNARRRFVTILSQNINHITDAPSQSHFIACSLVMATYEQLLENQVDKKHAIEQLTYAFLQPGRFVITWIMRISLWLTRNPQNMIVNETRRKLGMYGQSFEFDEELDINHFVSIVNRCGYHDFFAQNSRPELTVIFCEWDKLWIDEIKRHDCGVQFTRPYTMGQGGKCCRFEFDFSDQQQ